MQVLYKAGTNVFVCLGETSKQLQGYTKRAHSEGHTTHKWKKMGVFIM